MKIIFAGTPEFAAIHLQALIEAENNILAVLTQPDRRAGRGRKLRPGPVKTLAHEKHLEVLQPLNLRNGEVMQQLEEYKPDLIVVVAYGLILPKPVLELPALGCINVHASLLPRWRGAAPIQRAIMTGDSDTGISIMQMDKGLDTGPILLFNRCPIEAHDTGQTLHDRLAKLGTQSLLKALAEMERGGLSPTPQDDNLAIYAPKLEKAEARLDWNHPAGELERRIRAFNPWPVAFTTLGEDNLRVWEAETLPSVAAAPNGRIVKAGQQGIEVSTASGILRILRLQLPGGRPVTAADYLNAHRSPEGATLG
ncbi:MAG: methionyl-tRNA formyltransferase [Gammaproteobacteria bacterium]|nr:methionyl-tRNA formyltransferase [Gammaproteobacteria bacterium]